MGDWDELGSATHIDIRMDVHVVVNNIPMKHMQELQEIVSDFQQRIRCFENRRCNNDIS